MIHVGICDDDPVFREGVVDLLHRAYSLGTHTHVFHNGLELLHFMEHSRTLLDVLLLDIRMPGLNGIPTARRIRRVDRDMVIILITDFDDYVFDGYEVQAFRYVLKPLEAKSFLQVFEQAIAEASRRRTERALVVQTKSAARKVPLSEILYIESDGRKKTIVTGTGKITYYDNLSDLEEQLRPQGFYRTHKCYLVNLEHIVDLDKAQATVLLTGDRRILISKKKIQPLLSMLKKHMVC